MACLRKIALLLMLFSLTSLGFLITPAPAQADSCQGYYDLPQSIPVNNPFDITFHNLQAGAYRLRFGHGIAVWGFGDPFNYIPFVTGNDGRGTARVSFGWELTQGAHNALLENQHADGSWKNFCDPLNYSVGFNAQSCQIGYNPKGASLTYEQQIFIDITHAPTGPYSLWVSKGRNTFYHQSNIIIDQRGEWHGTLPAPKDFNIHPITAPDLDGIDFYLARNEQSSRGEDFFCTGTQRVKIYAPVGNTTPIPMPTAVPCSARFTSNRSSLTAGGSIQGQPDNIDLTWEWADSCPRNSYEFIGLFRPEDRSPDDGQPWFYLNCRTSLPTTPVAKLGTCTLSLVTTPNLAGNTYYFRLFGVNSNGGYNIFGQVPLTFLPRGQPSLTPVPAPAIAPTIITAAGQACDIDLGLEVTGTPTDPEKMGVYTAIGCVPTQPVPFVKGFLKFVAGFAGAISLLLMFFGALQMITSAGNADALKRAHEQFSSAIIGLLFIIFSVLFLEVIGIDILNLPGLGPKP